MLLNISPYYSQQIAIKRIYIGTEMVKIPQSLNASLGLSPLITLIILF
jgi:hypothetical protein